MGLLHYLPGLEFSLAFFFYFEKKNRNEINYKVYSDLINISIFLYFHSQLKTAHNETVLDKYCK